MAETVGQTSERGSCQPVQLRHYEPLHLAFRRVDARITLYAGSMRQAQRP